MKSSEIFDKIMLRVSGLDNSFYRNNTKSHKLLNSQLSEINKLRSLYKEDKEKLVFFIEKQIAKLRSREKLDLIQVKQLLHADKLEIATLTGPNLTISKSIKALREQLASIRSLTTSWTKMMEELKNSEEEQLIEIFSRSKELRKALQIASPTLLNSLLNYPSLKEKKRRQALFGLLKYFGRMSYKTSPFSYFTTTNFVGYDELSETKLSQELTYKSVFSLNLSKFHDILYIIKNSKFFRGYLKIKLNSTLVRKKDRFHFYMTVNNKDIFNDLERNGFLDLAYSILKTREYTYSEFQDTAETKFETANKSLGIDGILEHLEKAGFLTISHGLNLMKTDFLHEFEIFLTSIKEREHADFFREKFAIINSNLIDEENTHKDLEYTQIRLSVIVNAVDAIFRRVCEISIQDESDATLCDHYLKGKDKQLGTLIFEDVYSNFSIGIDEGKLKSVTEDLIYFLSKIDYLDLRQDDQHHFLTIIQNLFPTRKRIPLLEAYRAYSEFKIENPNIDHTFNARLLGSELHKNSLKYTDIDISTFTKPWRIDLPLDFLDAIESYNPLWRKPSENKRESKAAYIQFSRVDDSYQFILNGFAVGYGKWFSRFLNHNSSDNLAHIKDFNARNSPSDYLSVENVDSMCGNANIHPLLFDHELDVPGAAKFNADPSKQINLNDLYFLIGKNNLHVYHQPTKKKVNVFDLGFYSSAGRSRLFQLLDHFNPTTNINVTFITDSILLKFDYMHHICYVDNFRVRFRRFPRLKVKNIVLAREKWVIFTEDLREIINRPESVINIIKLRDEIGLPDEVFVTFSGYITGEKGKARQAKDAHKPTYINLSSPLFIHFFFKLLKNTEAEKIEIREMLPSNDDNVRASMTHTTEILTQFAY